MAAGSAHLTGLAAPKPSIFEVLSHEGFAKALKPAVFHVVKVLAEQNPSGWVGEAFRYFDELYLAFDAIVQWHYLLTRGATLSEAFYGLERKLPSQEYKLARVRLSYLVTILLPYAGSKLESLYKSEMESETSPGNDSNDQNASSKMKQRFLKAFVQWYPYMKAVLRGVNICYLLGYTFDRSEYHSLPFKMLNMTLGYTSEERSRFMEEKNAELWMSSKWRNPRNLPKLTFRLLGESVLFAVEIGTFFIQFLEWWYNDDKRARITVNSANPPPAPQTLKDNQNIQNIVKLLPSDINKCPMCRKDFKNPTVISVSGMVYCYGCIFPHLNANVGTCPVTNLPCNINHLIRIYNN